MKNVRHSVLVFAVVVLLLLLPSLSFGAGFALFEHGARGVALGGAFGATANDATALYYNPAGVAFLDGNQAALGVYFIGLKSDFQGANPYPGMGYKASQKSQIFHPPHMYLTYKLGEQWTAGFAVNAPFGLGTWWEDEWAGRYISRRVDLQLLNLNPSLTYKFSDNLAASVGADYYTAKVDLTRALGSISPYTQQVVDVGRVRLTSPQNAAWGWNVGILAKINSEYSVGLAYRSRVKVNFKGTAYFTQIPTGHTDFDARVATLLPFSDTPKVRTSIEFPDELRLATAWHSGAWVVGVDGVRMGWSSFKNLPFTFPDYPALSTVRKEDYRDRWSYHLGIEYKASSPWAYQFGYYLDQSPVPTHSVSPLLPDSNRKGVSVGFSRDIGQKMRLDVSYLHLIFKERSTKGRDGDNFNGKYANKAEIFGFTVVYKL